MRFYLFFIVAIAILHIYFSFLENKSPLNVQFLILIAIPYFIYIWKEVSRLKIGKDSIEIEKLKQNVNEVIKRFSHKKIFHPNDINDLFRTVESNEWMTLILARMLIRNGLISLLPNHRFGSCPEIYSLISTCFDKKIITKEEKDDLERLRDITFYAEWWWSKNPPTYSDWKWALDNSKRIIYNLLEKQHMNS